MACQVLSSRPGLFPTVFFPGDLDHGAQGFKVDAVPWASVRRLLFGSFQYLWNMFELTMIDHHAERLHADMAVPDVIVPIDAPTSIHL